MARRQSVRQQQALDKDGPFVRWLARRSQQHQVADHPFTLVAQQLRASARDI
jgi:hypothetical protein